MKEEKKKEGITRRVKKDDPHRTSTSGWSETHGRYNVNLYQKRMMLCITEAVQPDLIGQKNIVGRKIEVFKGLEKKANATVTIPMHLILQDEDSSNLYAVKAAAKKLIKNVCEFEDEKGNWLAFAPITAVFIPAGASTMSIQVNHLYWDQLLNFKRGYRKYNTRVALALKSVYSIRFYQMMSKRKEPITYDIKELKAMFGLKDKYKLTADFVRYVIEPSKRELDGSSPWSFTYEANKVGKRIDSFTFYPVYQRKFDDEAIERKELLQKINPSFVIPDSGLRDFLMRECGFTSKDITGDKNRILLGNIQVLLSPTQLVEELTRIIAFADKNEKPRVPYIITSLKNICKDFGIDPDAEWKKQELRKIRNGEIKIKPKYQRYETLIRGNLAKIQAYLDRVNQPSLFDDDEDL